MKVAKLYGKSLNGDCGTHHVCPIFDSEHGSDEGSSSGSISPTPQIYPAQVYMAGSSRANGDEPAYPLEVVLPDQVTRLTITRDMAIRALKHVEEGTYPPPDAPREDLMAVQIGRAHV